MRANAVWIALNAVWLMVGYAASASAGVVEVPEPTSFALLAAGLGGAAWVKFRRRR
jgi:hypothetical protein